MTPAGEPEAKVLSKLVQTIEQAKVGLDPRVLAFWYRRIENQARTICPSEELKNSVQIIQDPLLPMRFQFKASKRAIPYVIQAVESNENEMPFATKLYFEKFLEIIRLELKNYEEKSSENS